jgi:hypothetical protein
LTTTQKIDFESKNGFDLPDKLIHLSIEEIGIQKYICKYSGIMNGESNDGNKYFLNGEYSNTLLLFQEIIDILNKRCQVSNDKLIDIFSEEGNALISDNDIFKISKIQPKKLK